GCAHHGRRGGAVAAGVPPLEAVLPPALVQPLPVNDDHVGVLSEVEVVLRPSYRPPAEYHALSAEQCQCLAVKASTEGNRLAADRRALMATSSHHGLSEKERLKIQVLWAAELEARNHSAAAALTAYYQIAQAEANRPILQQSLQEIEDAMKKVDRMHEIGVQVPFDGGDLNRQKLGILDRQLKLTSQLDQLNAELVQLVGLASANARPRIWPAADFTVNVAPTDMDLAVAVGMSTRPELRLLASLRSSLRAKNVAITRGVVGGPVSTAMMPLSHLCKLIGQCFSNHRELPTRERQLAEHYAQRQREVTAEIQQAVLEVESRLRRVAVAKEAMNSWRTELDELAKKAQIDEATFIDISRARLKRLEAESDKIEQIMAWKIALVKVKDGQGMLVTECQGNCCQFVDFPTVQETGGGPLPELLPPEDYLPNPADNHSDLPEGEVLAPLGAANASPQLPPALPLPPVPLPSPTLPPATHKSVVSRVPLPEERAASALPDMAVEPPGPSDQVTPDGP
ncbi:MAG TPA: TolC family protein, partial [Pirellulales bacterium]|nr:TolC family protein [Pirellulales bacterium]